MAKLRFSSAALAANEHKNPDFVLEMAENEGFEGQKSTKTPILCSKRPKTGVPKAKKAQKPRFCARKARKWGFQRQKAHKNGDFVLGKKGNGIGNTANSIRNTANGIGKPAVRGN
ncbi:MAG: hypothetical protein SOV89_02865 [Candidatus Egerieousia sp.]|nr:hypothetical protein [Candidatus Egerieousia sp.]